ncbi:MAG: 5'-nucleotidase [Phenylobacterium sp.]|jgi:5'-nucleotidase
MNKTNPSQIKPINILLSNDDGVTAPGLMALYQAISEISANVTVIAPDRNCSAASNSLTLLNPLRVQKMDNGFLSVNGTPTDCVNLGISQLLKEKPHKPDLVVAGINDGPNLGDDVLYSGTVAAATEGRHMGLPAIAVSLVGKVHFATAGQVAMQVVKQLQSHPLPADQILNINVPDVPLAQIKGIKVTRLGRRHQADSMSKQADPWGRDIYWYGPLGKARTVAEDTDFYAVANNFVSITPLTVDMTAYQSLSGLESWLSDVKL